MKRFAVILVLTIAAVVACALCHCSSIEQFPRRACVFDELQRFDTGTLIDKREDGARLFKYDDRSRGDLGYMWIADNDPSRQIRPCKAADALTPDAAEALNPRGVEH